MSSNTQMGVFLESDIEFEKFNEHTIGMILSLRSPYSGGFLGHVRTFDVTDSVEYIFKRSS